MLVTESPKNSVTLAPGPVASILIVIQPRHTLPMLIVTIVSIVITIINYGNNLYCTPRQALL